MTPIDSSGSQDENLYFIAIIPPPPLYGQVLELKEYFRTQYNSKASLNSPPHITLHMPFKWRMKKEKALTEQLEGFFQSTSAAALQLNDFAAFPPRVIYINVTENPELNELQKNLRRFCKKELNLFNANYKELPFHPHLTIAFRDLKKVAFIQAWEEFKNKSFKGEFIGSKISLLKHSGKVWEIYREFNLQ